MRAFVKSMLKDKLGRDIHDLRLSVTDRCNFSCVYCKSADPKNYFPHDDLLTWDEYLPSILMNCRLVAAGIPCNNRLAYPYCSAGV